MPLDTYCRPPCIFCEVLWAFFVNIIFLCAFVYIKMVGLDRIQSSCSPKDDSWCTGAYASSKVSEEIKNCSSHPLFQSIVALLA